MGVAQTPQCGRLGDGKPIRLNFSFWRPNLILQSAASAWRQALGPPRSQPRLALVLSSILPGAVGREPTDTPGPVQCGLHTPWPPRVAGVFLVYRAKADVISVFLEGRLSVNCEPSRWRLTAASVCAMGYVRVTLCRLCVDF